MVCIRRQRQPNQTTVPTEQDARPVAAGWLFPPGLPRHEADFPGTDRLIRGQVEANRAESRKHNRKSAKRSRARSVYAASKANFPLTFADAIAIIGAVQTLV